MQRTITLHNIKGHADKFVDFSDGQLFTFVGKNKSGKSTIIQCLESIAMVKNTMDNPLKTGEEEGKVTRTGTDRDGNPITIEMEVTKSETIFRASYLNQQGERKVISNPAKIRDLIGTYFPLSVADVFEMLKYAEGKKKFIKEYLYACLTTAQREKLYELDKKISDKKNKETEGNLFHQRTAVNRIIEEKNVILRNITVNPSEEVEIGKIPAYEGTMTKLKKQKDDYKANEALKTTTKNLKNDADEIINKVIAYTDNFKFEEEGKAQVSEILEFFEASKQELDKKIAEIDVLLKDPIETLESRISIGETKISDAKAYKAKQEQRQNATEDLRQAELKLDGLNKQIEEVKKQRLEIIQNSPLPAGISFDEEEITLNDLPFTETSVSDTEARLAIMELLCSITTADFVNIGDWSLYDKESRKAILAVAKKNNRMVFGQLVTDDDEVECKTVIVE